MVSSSLMRGQTSTVHSVLDAGDTFCYSIELKKFKIKPGISFHFFTSRLPCGDCAIISVPKTVEDDSPENLRNQIPEHCPEQIEIVEGVPDPSTSLVDDGVESTSQRGAHHTGAKLIQRKTLSNHSAIVTELVQNVPGQSDVESGQQQLGAIRRKPGRGEPTLSMSCSDKLARWGMLGLQGATLMEMLSIPVYLDSITVALGDGQEEKMVLAALQRGLIERCEEIAKRLEVPYR